MPHRESRFHRATLNRRPGERGEPAAFVPQPPPPPIADPAALLAALTTEHFTLQTARNATISDSTGRSALYLSTVSSAVVALAFIGQVSRVGTPFRVFALVLLPALFVLGLLTYARLIESAIEDAYLGRAINRIRRYYAQVDPERAAYLLLSVHDDLDGVMANTGRNPGRWHLLSHTATMVTAVASLVGGAFVSLLAVAIFPGVGLTVAATLGAAVCVILVAVLLVHQSRTWHRAQAGVAALFPTE